MKISGAKISIAAPLSFDTDIKKGTMTVGDMFKLYRFENLLYKMRLSGKEIKDLLEYSSGLWFNQMKSENDPLLKYHKNDRGRIILDNPFYNFSSVAGLIYTVDVSKPIGNRIQIKSFVDGKKFRLDNKYEVAVNSYTGNGGGELLTRGAGINKSELSKRVIFSTEKDLRYYMMKYIEKAGSVNPEKTENWKIIPEAWWEKGSERDSSLLFSKQ
jgi:2',3'-cyclic-nucleotide 2'-phosphodiesterase/3'-nucleotidase